jgi:hypothetical protein
VLYSPGGRADAGYGYRSPTSKPACGIRSRDWAAEKGIVLGYANGAFGINDTVSREQIAAILFRYAAYKVISLLRTTARILEASRMPTKIQITRCGPQMGV